MSQAEETVWGFLFCFCYLPVRSGHHHLSLPEWIPPQLAQDTIHLLTRWILPECEALPRNQRHGSQGPSDAENCSWLVLSGFLEPVFVVWSVLKEPGSC